MSVSLFCQNIHHVKWSLYLWFAYKINTRKQLLQPIQFAGGRQRILFGFLRLADSDSVICTHFSRSVYNLVEKELMPRSWWIEPTKSNHDSFAFLGFMNNLSHRRSPP